MMIMMINKNETEDETTMKLNEKEWSECESNELSLTLGQLYYPKQLFILWHYDSIEGNYYVGQHISNYKTPWLLTGCHYTKGNWADKRQQIQRWDESTLRLQFVVESQILYVFTRNMHTIDGFGLAKHSNYINEQHNDQYYLFD